MHFACLLCFLHVTHHHPLALPHPHTYTGTSCTLPGSRGLTCGDIQQGRRQTLASTTQHHHPIAPASYLVGVGRLDWQARKAHL